MGGGRSAPTIEVDQCEEMDNALKEEFGDDYLTNREKFPLTKEALGYVASTPCKTYFKYDDLVKEYCVSVDRYTDQIGGGQTCEKRTDINMRVKWCELDDKGQPEGTRLKTDGKCSQTKLASKYHSTASNFCKSHPRDEWCTCYNLKNKVCDTIPSAAGCDYYKVLKENRAVFGPEPEMDDPSDPTNKIKGYSDGYNILKENAHCTPRRCDKGYIPENVKSDCASSYKFCDKDINIQSQSIASIAVDCNADMGELKLPDWWDEERDNSFWEDAREPPFDKFPLNKLPITSFPKKFNWKNINVRYLTYGGVSSVSLCCLCMILIISSLKRR